MRPSFHGLLVLDKPGGITSRDAVDRALGWFPRGTRVGHTGTLDPLATGVLVLCVGAATRLTEYVQRMDKVYETEALLGARSTTDDADGEVTPVEVAAPPDRATVTACLAGFVGEIDQVPPAFSAAKVTGRRAYALARRGEAVSLQPRRVRVYRIDVLGYEYPRLRLEVLCGKGTYIRSLVRDLGERLGCGGLVQTLRRARVGPFTAADAVPWDAPAESIRSRLMPLAAAMAGMPRLTLDAELIRRLRHGQAIANPSPAVELESAVFDEAGSLVGVVRVEQPSGLVRPQLILPAG